MVDLKPIPHMPMPSSTPTSAPARTLLASAVPALLIGVGCSLILLAVMGFAEVVQQWLWQTLPQWLGVAPHSKGWIVGMLTATGIAVGLVVAYMPGHAGPHPATASLIGAPQPLPVLPGLLVALVLGLAGGVSLGPEYPIMTINIALAVAIGRAVRPESRLDGWVMLAASGTIGALFGTPVAAALILTEPVMRGQDTSPLWNRLFAPLVAAGAGALTTTLFIHPIFAVQVPAYSGGGVLLDLVAGSAIAVMAAALGLLAVYLLPPLYRLGQRIGHPLLVLGGGGLLLGLLGVLGGPLTLFKGLTEMQALGHSAAALGPAQLALIGLVKLAALLVAAACGFRGGRIFPAVFVGVAFGLFAHAVVPAIPAALTVACGVLGLVLAVTRDGWLGLFMAAAVVPDLRLLPILCLVVLPAWLLLAGKPQMQVIAAR
ncbi:putative ion-transport protein YfeO [Chitiniphilus shinanonensis]|uniref:Ion-transport protein YfeO n=2 Tax=Chitiniphilus shinanonensis TaxID=553088 RepID=A0ABQ6BVB1_9NEIS|nr:putative ion-transport protein YfeO [Chitiniphilus shinanonensis]